MSCHIREDTGGVRDTEGGGPRSRLDKDAVMGTVKAPSILTISVRPEKPRATRIAAIVASDPLDTNRSISIPGWSWMIIPAYSGSSGMGVPYNQPFSSWVAIACRTRGCA